MVFEQLMIYKRIQNKPLLFGSYIKRFDNSIRFCKGVISFDNNLFFYLPKDLQSNSELIDIVLNNASTMNINFPFDKLSITDEIQLNKLKMVYIIKAYIRFYEDLYGLSDHNIKQFYFKDEEIVNSLFLHINGLLDCLPDLDSDFLKFKYGLIDGEKKVLKIYAVCLIVDLMILIVILNNY